MEDLIQFVFIALFVLFGLLGGSKKRRQRRTGGGSQTESAGRVDTARRERQPTPPPQPTRRRPDEFAPTVPHKMGGDVVDEIFDLLRTRTEEPPDPYSDERQAFEDEDEAQSLETLDPAGGKSHDRFHALYMEAPPLEVEATKRVSPRQRLGLTGRKRLRDAIILTEVLGVPKALRDPTESGPWSGPVG